MEGETRLPDLNAITLAHIKINRRSTTQIPSVDRAIGIEHLGMTQGDPGAGRSGHFQPDHAHHVLAQVINPSAGLGFLERFRLSSAI